MSVGAVLLAVPPPIGREVWVVGRRTDLDLLSVADAQTRPIVVLAEDRTELLKTKETGLKALAAWLDARAIFGPQARTVTVRPEE